MCILPIEYQSVANQRSKPGTMASRLRKLQWQCRLADNRRTQNSGRDGFAPINFSRHISLICLRRFVSRQCGYLNFFTDSSGVNFSYHSCVTDADSRAFCRISHTFSYLRSRFGIERHPYTKSRIDQIPCVCMCNYSSQTTEMICIKNYTSK